MIYLENNKAARYYFDSSDSTNSTDSSDSTNSSDSTDFSCSNVKYGDSTFNGFLSGEIFLLSYYINKIGIGLTTGIKVISSNTTIFYISFPISA